MNQKQLKELLNYDINTGLFAWRISPNPRIKTGSIAGCPNNYGYIHIRINKKPYKAHRLAWLYIYGCFPPKLIDHINHDKADNRIVNLRLANHSENGRNRLTNKNNLSGIAGVNWKKESNKWVSQIQVNSIKRHLGYFIDKFEAICARKSAENKYNFTIANS